MEHSAEQVSEGILEIIRIIREKHTSAYIVLPVSLYFLNIFFSYSFDIISVGNI